MAKEEDFPRGKPPPGLPNKREIRQAAARLRNLRHFDAVPQSDQERLRNAVQDLRTGDDYAAAVSCAACTTARAQSGDKEALCAEHLRKALGF